jgi:hypothetical protein
VGLPRPAAITEKLHEEEERFYSLTLPGLDQNFGEICMRRMAETLKRFSMHKNCEPCLFDIIDMSGTVPGREMDSENVLATLPLNNC